MCGKGDGMTLHNTLIVDDSPRTFCRNYGNAVYITTYTLVDKQTDQEFYRVMAVLESLLKQYQQSNSFRTIQRPRWHASA